MEIRNISGELIFSDDSQSIEEVVINAISSGADLSGADLSWADLSEAGLRRADLRGADLRGADLSGADLSGAVGITCTQVSFNWHGELGRQLSAIKIDGDIVLFCGCFKGSVDDLIEYIEGGDEKYKHSRTVALNTVMSLIKH